MSTETESEQDEAEDDQGEYSELEIEMTEEHLESLKHGSGISYEFEHSDGVLAVHVDSERDLDKDWLMNGDSSSGRALNPRIKGLVGVSLAMAGMLWAAAPLVDFYPLIIGGVVSLLGGIYAIDQIPTEFSGVSADAE